MARQKKPPLLLYFNGLGNGEPRLREALVMGPARARGYKIVPRKTDWSSKEPYSEQLANDVAFTKGLLSQTARMILVGSSAGVSRAINVFGEMAERRDLLGVVGLCGRTSVGDLAPWDWRTMDRMAHMGDNGNAYPAFCESVAHVESAVSNLAPDRLEDIVLMHHYGDELVPHQTQVIAGTSQEFLLAPGHGVGILAAGILLPGVIKQHFLQ